MHSSLTAPPFFQPWVRAAEDATAQQADVARAANDYSYQQSDYYSNYYYRNYDYYNNSTAPCVGLEENAECDW